MNQLCIIGHPSRLGGADTELDHQLHCWQAMGVEVHLCHTGPLDANLKAMGLEERGCIYHEPCDWPGCPGSIEKQRATAWPQAVPYPDNRCPSILHFGLSGRLFQTRARPWADLDQLTCHAVSDYSVQQNTRQERNNLLGIRSTEACFPDDNRVRRSFRETPRVFT